MVQEYVDSGYTKDQAEAHVLEGAVALFNQQKIGFIDLKYFYQILGYDFSGELAKTMEDIKKAVRMDYGLTDIIRGEMKSGKSKKEATEDAIRVAYESFQEGNIEEPELLDMLLWSLGYRLTEEFLSMELEQMKQKILYEEDN